MEKVIFKWVQLDFGIAKVIEDFGKARFELNAKKNRYSANTEEL